MGDTRMVVTEQFVTEGRTRLIEISCDADEVAIDGGYSVFAIDGFFGPGIDVSPSIGFASANEFQVGAFGNSGLREDDLVGEYTDLEELEALELRNDDVMEMSNSWYAQVSNTNTTTSTLIARVGVVCAAVGSEHEN